MCLFLLTHIYIMFSMQNGCTLLSAACAGGLSDVAEFLINKGAPIDVTDRVSYSISKQMYWC